MMRNRIRRIRSSIRHGPWPVGSELVFSNDVYTVVEYERSRDGQWVVLLRLGDVVPDFWLVGAVADHLNASK